MLWHIKGNGNGTLIINWKLKDNWCLCLEHQFFFLSNFFLFQWFLSQWSNTIEKCSTKSQNTPKIITKTRILRKNKHVLNYLSCSFYALKWERKKLTSSPFLCAWTLKLQKHIVFVRIRESYSFLELKITYYLLKTTVVNLILL